MQPPWSTRPTSLVGGQTQNWDHRGHFFAAAAKAMRRILVDNALRKQAICHGGGRRRVALQDYHLVTQSPDGLLALDEALTRFACEEPAMAELLKLCRMSQTWKCTWTQLPSNPS